MTLPRLRISTDGLNRVGVPTYPLVSGEEDYVDPLDTDYSVDDIRRYGALPWTSGDIEDAPDIDDAWDAAVLALKARDPLSGGTIRIPRGKWVTRRTLETPGRYNGGIAADSFRFRLYAHDAVIYRAGDVEDTPVLDLHGCFGQEGGAEVYGGTFDGLYAAAGVTGFRMTSANTTLRSTSVRRMPVDGIEFKEEALDVGADTGGLPIGCNFFDVHIFLNGRNGLYIPDAVSGLTIRGGRIEGNGECGIWMRNAGVVALGAGAIVEANGYNGTLDPVSFSLGRRFAQIYINGGCHVTMLGAYVEQGWANQLAPAIEIESGNFPFPSFVMTGGLITAYNDLFRILTRFDGDDANGPGGALRAFVVHGVSLNANYLIWTTGVMSLSATATGYERAAGSFIDDGFQVGMLVEASGFAESENNGESGVTAVTALALTVTKAGGTVVEAAGAGREILVPRPAEVHKPALFAFGDRGESIAASTDEIAATATGYERSSGSFVDDGFKIYHYVETSGFVEPENNGTSRITAVTALTMTVTKTGGTVVEAEDTGRSLATVITRTFAYGVHIAGNAIYIDAMNPELGEMPNTDFYQGEPSYGWIDSLGGFLTGAIDVFGKVNFKEGFESPSLDYLQVGKTWGDAAVGTGNYGQMAGFYERVSGGALGRFDIGSVLGNGVVLNLGVDDDFDPDNPYDIELPLGFYLLGRGALNAAIWNAANSDIDIGTNDFLRWTLTAAGAWKSQQANAKFLTTNGGKISINRHDDGQENFSADNTGIFNARLAYYAGGTKVLGLQGAAVADAAGGATVDAEARTAINALLARFRAHGAIAT